MSLSKFTYEMAMKYKCGGAGENLERDFTLRNALLVSFQCLFPVTWSWVDDGIISLEKIHPRKSWNCPITRRWRSWKWRQWLHHISTTAETKACCTEHKEKRWAHCTRAGFLEPHGCLLGKAGEWLGSYLDGPIVEIVCLPCFPVSCDQLNFHLQAIWTM